MSKNQFKQAAKASSPVESQTVEPELNDATAARSRLARDIAAILANPATPVRLYNAIVDEITDWSSAHLEQEAHGAAYLAKSLECFNRREARRKGGER
jgi:hypothetical protein